MKFKKEIEKISEVYIKEARKELHDRWDAWEIDLLTSEVYETIGGLLARQVSLATQVAYNPGVWNEHIAPIVLRSMIDTFITLAWIVDDPEDRSQEYILYGLGQDKLYMEHLKESNKNEKDPETEKIIESLEDYINTRRYPFLTDVNVGSWSGKSTRQMAEEANCLDLYRFAYQPFSSSTHSMWNHIDKYNLEYCNNPLHKYHKVPIDSELGLSFHYFYLAGKYLEKSFSRFDETYNFKLNRKSSFENLTTALNKLSDALSEEEENKSA